MINSITKSNLGIKGLFQLLLVVCHNGKSGKGLKQESGGKNRP